jgi:hypothetical protein
MLRKRRNKRTNARKCSACATCVDARRTDHLIVRDLELNLCERELATWRRRLATIEPSPALVAEVQALADEIEAVRERAHSGLAVSGERLIRRFARIRALWEYLGYESTTTSA